MTDTSESLLDVLRESPNDAHWRRFVALYTPKDSPVNGTSATNARRMSGS